MSAWEVRIDRWESLEDADSKVVGQTRSETLPAGGLRPTIVYSDVHLHLSTETWSLVVDRRTVASVLVREIAS